MAKKHSEKADKHKNRDLKNRDKDQHSKDQLKKKDRKVATALEAGSSTADTKTPPKSGQPKTGKGKTQKPKTEKSKKTKAGKTKSLAKSAKDRAAQTRKGRIDKAITNREFKLLLKPDGLERRKSVAGYQAFMQDFCKKQNIDYLPLDAASTGLRNVVFYDTPDEDLRDNRIILRVRASRKDLWVDEWCEVTLKRRHDDLDTAAAFDPTPHLPAEARIRMRFKEEILRGSDPDNHRFIYSNNAIINTVPIDRLEKNRIGEIYPLFPGLMALGVSSDKQIGKVGGNENTILEACLPLGTIMFDDDVVAHCDLGVWFRSAGVPLVGELAFAYRVNAKNRKNRKAHVKANRLFARLQEALHDHLYEGSTKTALVYGKPE